MPARVSISACDLNYLVYRYLLESGFQHSSFSFLHEARLSDESLDQYRSLNVEPGKLVSLIHKALQLLHVEIHMDDDGIETACEVPMSLLGPHVCIPSQRKPKPQIKRLKTEDSFDDTIVEVRLNSSQIIPISEPLITLQFSCERYYLSSFNPQDDSLLATASLDSVVGLWNVPLSKPPDVSLLHHRSILQENEITALCWSPNGEYLASGSKDGTTKVFSKNGELCSQFQHASLDTGNPVFGLMFSPQSSLLASGDSTGSIIVWDLDVNMAKHKFSLHSNAILALDWLNEVCFASASADSCLVFTNLLNLEHLNWNEHMDSINEIKWDPSKHLLASCSDDSSIRIWDPEKQDSIAILQAHDKGVFAIDWNPKPPNKTYQLASASLDSSIRIWDVPSATCIFCLSRFVNLHCALRYRYLISN